MSRPRVDGVERCIRYAFGPNRLHLCGPDANREALAYIGAGLVDRGLTNILKKFATLYPYLETIARANLINDPFDNKVIEAYWLGNDLLDKIPQKFFYRHLIENINLKKRLDTKSFRQVKSKLEQGAYMHHSFHVFNIWKRTGHIDENHTLHSMDNCRISWGQVMSISGPKIEVWRPPLIIEGHQLVFGPAQKVEIFRSLQDTVLVDDLNVGDYISMHWGMPCEILSKPQLDNLKKYTAHSLALANQSL